jgi:glc operon protein GlcG
MSIRHVSFVISASILMLAGVTGAHAESQTGLPASVPEQMPFDIPYGPPLSLDIAQKAAAAALVEAKKHHWKEAVAVVGPDGRLITFVMMDGTQNASIDIAQAKARTSALFRRSSKVFEAAVNTGGAPGTLSLLAVSNSIASEGGIPIVIGGKLVGAIGASGGISTQDGVTAQAGLNAVTSR